MPHLSCYLELPYTPRWNEGNGLWYIYPDYSRRPLEMNRYFPSVNLVCFQLWGTPIRKRDPLTLEFETVGVNYPLFRERCMLFLEGIELVKVTRNREELFTLASYRRQVTRKGGLPLDRLLLMLAESFNPQHEEWETLAGRMPERSEIRCICEERGQSASKMLAEAAE